MKPIFLVIVVLILGFSSCRKDDPVDTMWTEVDLSGTYIGTRYYLRYEAAIQFNDTFLVTTDTFRIQQSGPIVHTIGEYEDRSYYLSEDLKSSYDNSSSDIGWVFCHNICFYEDSLLASKFYKGLVGETGNIPVPNSSDLCNYISFYGVKVQ